MHYRLYTYNINIIPNRLVLIITQHTREKKKRTAEPKMERCVYERYDSGVVERGHSNKQGRMAEEAIIRYRPI